MGYILGCPRKFGSMVRINGLYNPLILTIDPNFQRDIQVATSNGDLRDLRMGGFLLEFTVYVEVKSCGGLT